MQLASRIEEKSNKLGEQLDLNLTLEWIGGALVTLGVTISLVIKIAPTIKKMFSKAKNLALEIHPNFIAQSFEMPLNPFFKIQ